MLICLHNKSNNKDNKINNNKKTKKMNKTQINNNKSK